MADQEIVMKINKKRKKDVVGWTPNSEAGEYYKNLKGGKKRRAGHVLKELHALHKQYGKMHLTKVGKKVGDKTCTDRWYFIHHLVAQLYFLGFRVEKVNNIKQKHCIALCRYWESLYQAANISNNKTYLRTVLHWVGKAEMLDQIPMDVLFEDPKCIYRPLKTTTDKSFAANYRSELLPLLGDIKKDIASFKYDESFTLCDVPDLLDHFEGRASIKKQYEYEKERRSIIMLKLIYWFGLRTAEAAFFSPKNDIHIDAEKGGSYIVVRKQGAKGGRSRRVYLHKSEQVEFLQELKTRMYCKDRIMHKDVKKTDSFIRSFNRYCGQIGLSKENKLNPHSIRHMYAQGVYADYSGRTAPIKKLSSLKKGSKVDKFAKRFVAEQLGHNRPSVAGAYIG